MKKLLTFLLACASVFPLKAQSPQADCTNDERILLEERTGKLSQRLALKIIRKKADTAFFKVNPTGISREGSENIYYYHVSTFPPVVRVVKKIDKVFLSPNISSEPPWKWEESRAPYYEVIRTDRGLRAWWYASFVLSFLLALAIIGKSDYAERSLWAILICSLLVGLVANMFNTGAGTENFWIWDKLFSLIGTSFLGVLLYVLIFPIRRFIVDILRPTPSTA